YSNPDYYPPTISGVNLMREHFAVRMVCRNMQPPSYQWPSDVVLERVGSFASAADKATLSPAAKLNEYRSFIAAVARARREAAPRLIYAYDPHALAAVFIACTASTPPCPVVFHAHEQAQLDRLSLLSLQTWIVRYAMRKAR